MYKLSDYISSVVIEKYLIQITSLSCVQLSDVNSTSGLRLRILSRLAVVEITTEKIAVPLREAKTYFLYLLLGSVLACPFGAAKEDSA